MTPMGTNLAELDGTPGPAMLAYFEERAKGGYCRIGWSIRRRGPALQEGRH